MLNQIEVYFLLFMSYAFLGWCMEVTCKLLQYKRFINRGFLIGPYCPIYGWGALAITILLKSTRIQGLIRNRTELTTLTDVLHRQDLYSLLTGLMRL